MRFLGNGRPRSREHVERLHHSRLAAAAGVPGLGFWSGFLTDGPDAGTFVGWWILEPPEDQRTTAQAELGYRLLPRFWRQGLASEGARELIRYGFAECGLERIIAETMAVNAASRATMQSVGLRYVRTFHVPFDDPLPGSDQGEVEYAI